MFEVPFVNDEVVSVRRLRLVAFMFDYRRLRAASALSCRIIN